MALRTASWWATCCLALAVAAAACVESEPFLSQDAADVVADPGTVDSGVEEVIDDLVPADSGPADSGPADSGGDAPTPCIGTAECDDGQSCTTDGCVDGFCVFQVIADGTDCDTGSQCYEDGKCQSGECVGTLVVCAPNPDDCWANTCNSNYTGGCTPTLLLGASCTAEPDPCTTTRGSCGGIAPHCQAPPRFWQRSLGESAALDRAEDVIWTAQGGVLVVGAALVDGDEKTRAWLLDAGGAPQHVLTVGVHTIAADGRLAAGAQHPDGGFVLAGRDAAALSDGLIVRTDATLAVTDVTPVFPSPAAANTVDRLVTLHAAGDGFVAVGTSNKAGALGDQIWVVWLDGEGKPTSHDLFGGENADVAYAAVPTGPATVAIAGMTTGLGQAAQSGWVMVVEKGNGDPLEEWLLDPGAGGWRELTGIGAVPGGGYLVVGHDIVAGGDHQGYVAVLAADDALGVLWDAPIGTDASDDRILGLSPTTLDGHFIGVGLSDNGSAPAASGWMVALSPSDNKRLAWSHLHQAGAAIARQHLVAAAVSGEGTLVVAGAAEQPGPDEQGWALTTDGFGNNHCDTDCVSIPLGQCSDDNACTFDLCDSDSGQCTDAFANVDLLPCPIDPQ